MLQREILEARFWTFYRIFHFFLNSELRTYEHWQMIIFPDIPKNTEKKQYRSPQRDPNYIKNRIKTCVFIISCEFDMILCGFG